MAVIGLDVGTTGCKATAVDERGRTLCEEYREYNLVLPGPGLVEADPEAVWRGIESVLSAVAAACPEPVTSLAVASFGEAAVIADETGTPLGNSIFFTDFRGYEEAKELAADLGKESVEAATGMPVNGMYTLPKLLWIKKHRPGIFARIRKIMPFGSFAAYRLTGQNAADLSLASRTLMLNRRTGGWDRRLTDYAGIDASALPELVPAGEPVEKVLPSVARRLGLSPDTTVVSGCHDQIAAALGAGVTRAGLAVDGIGSAECITAMLPDDIDLPKLFARNICAEPSALPGRFVSLAFNNTSGAALKWYRDAFAAELRERCRRNGENTYRILDLEIKGEPSPVLFLPYLSGSGTPYMDSEAKGMLYGLTLGTEPRDIYRAVLEGMNYEMRFNLEILRDAGLVPEALTVAGGGASSETALRIKADILGVAVRVPENPQCGNVGLAALCASAEKRFRNPAEAARELVRFKATVEPNPEFAEKYAESYARYKRMYEAAKHIDAALKE